MWKPPDADFYTPRLPVSVVALPNTPTSPQSIRAILEMTPCAVLLHSIGTPTDFLKVISQGETAPRYMILAGHGTTKGIYFGRYGADPGWPEIDVSMLRDEHMPGEVIREHCNLPGCTVISGCCLGGEENMAHAFLANGLKSYIGCRTYPDSVAGNIFLANFFFGVLSKGLSDRDAWRRAIIACNHTDINQMSFFHSDGREERF
jgi:hypothetical protein